MIRPLRRHLAAGLVAAALAVAVLLRYVDPFRSGGLLPPCPLFALTGLYCPGCGTTRALHSLVHFDLPLALTMNPLMVLCLPLFAWLLADLAGWRPPALERWQARVRDARPWAVVVLGYALLRNLPWPPFAWLAPGGYAL
jgi:hypothetical protein